MGVDVAYVNACSGKVTDDGSLFSTTPPGTVPISTSNPVSLSDVPSPTTTGTSTSSSQQPSASASASPVAASASSVATGSGNTGGAVGRDVFQNLNTLAAAACAAVAIVMGGLSL